MTAMMMQVRMAAMLMLQMLRFKVGPDPVITNYREVNAVNLVGTGAVKSKFVNMPNSVNTLKILVGLYF